jgi:ABC-type nitrate/sulfonate/bicarbonate transport system permease component
MTRLGGNPADTAAALARTLAVPIACIVVLGLLWQATISIFDVPPYIMPGPLGAWLALVANAREMLAAVGFTLRNAAAGLAVAFLIANGLAAMFVHSDLLSRAVLPLVIGMRTAPVLAIAPLLILLFGRGVGTSIAVVVIVSFFPTMVNAMRGFRAARRNALELMHVLGATRAQTFLKVRLPFALPYIFTGLRSAATGAILSAMLAEWLSGAPGLGTLMLNASSYHKADLLWAAVLVSMAMALIVFTSTSLIERRLLAWRR